MNLRDREGKPWLHGIFSALMGLFILWIMLFVPSLQLFLVDTVNNGLYILEKPAMELRNIVRVSSNWVLERASLQERADQLELENQALKDTLARLQVTEPQQRESFMTARVTLRYADDWWSELRVDRGTADGVAVGAAVTSDGYLVGRVIRVGSNYAWVELITSPTFLIAAAVDETRDLGILGGDGRGNLRMLYIPEERGVKRGMRISTSLMSDKIPPGIPIGAILAPDEPKEGFLPMRVQAGAHLTQLYSVHIFRGRNN